MKLQGLSVIFTLVVIPLLLVLSYYISLQVDTITLQNSYNTKLLDATYDAMSAFEINTANEDLSSVSDSLRTIIEASNSIFFNTLATNMGLSNASKSYIEPYIPAVLYTLYDGYYIFAPTSVSQVMTDLNGVAVAAGDDNVSYDESNNSYKYSYEIENDIPNGNNANPSNCYPNEYLRDVEDYGQLLYLKNADDRIEEPTERNDPSDPNKITRQKLTASNLTTNPDEAVKKIKNVLKSYMPYSARYKCREKSATKDPDYKTVFGNGSEKISYDINVVYTLDNYISFEGYVQKDGEKIYYSESGYLIKGNDNNVNVEVSGSPIINNDSARYSQSEIQSIIENKLGGKEVKVTITDNRYVAGASDDKKVVLSTNSIMEFEGTNNIVSECEAIYSGIGNLLTESDRWNEKTLKQKYEILLTVLRNKQDEIENGEDEDGINLYDLTRVINKAQYNLDLMSSITYYAKAKIFTNWVNTHMSMIQAKDVVQIAGIEYGTVREGLEGQSETNNRDFSNQLDFRNDETYIFNNVAFGEYSASEEGNANLNEKDNIAKAKLNEYSVTEISQDSNFYSHKLRVIRSAIQYSLNLAMSVYNSNESYGVLSKSQIWDQNNKRKDGYAMPVLSYEEWEKITENPSIVAFMQGLSCGLKIYNNYQVVSSTNNELVVHPEQVYYVASNNDFSSYNTGGLGAGESFYHRIDCNKLFTEVNDDSRNQIMAFSSKDVKYDKVYDKTASTHLYKYDHKNLACYDCINDGNYIASDYVNIFTPADTGVFQKTKILREAFYKGVGKVRNNTYKMNAFATSSGYQSIYSDSEPGSTPSSTLGLNEIEAIRLTFGYTYDLNNSIDFKVKYNNSFNLSSDDRVYSIPANSKTYTIEVRLDDFTDQTETLSKGNIKFFSADGNDRLDKLTISLKFIEVVYK